MKIAIIEDDDGYLRLLKDVIRTHCSKDDWEIDFYSDPLDFVDAGYQVIIVDHLLPNITGKEFINTYSKQLDAEFALMSADISNFLDEELVENTKIAALIDKSEVLDIIEWLEYFVAKIKIRENIEKSIESSITSNGYSFEILHKEIALVEFRQNLLTEQSKQLLIHDLEKTNFKCIFCFNMPLKATSILLGQIIYFWNIIKQNKGCMAIVSNHEKLKQSFELCSLNRIVRMFDSVKAAEYYVEHTQVMTLQ